MPEPRSAEAWTRWLAERDPQNPPPKQPPLGWHWDAGREITEQVAQETAALQATLTEAQEELTCESHPTFTLVWCNECIKIDQAAWKIERDTLQRRVEALETFVAHKTTCEVRWIISSAERVGCTCGLEAALPGGADSRQGERR